jgi:hypothetical protein
MGVLKMANEKRLIDLTGQRFGKLVVIEYAGRNERRESLWVGGCPYVRFRRLENDFCSYGERKET